MQINCKFTPRGRFELPRGQVPTSSPGSIDRSNNISNKELNEYLSLREIEDICDEWLKAIRRYLIDYLEFVKWNVNKESTLNYLKYIYKKYPITYYRKRAYQIRKLLLYFNYHWATNIKLPSEPESKIKKVSSEDIENTITQAMSSKLKERYVALIYLGASTGLRAEELYQLKINDIDIKNRIVSVNHDPSNGQTTKTKKNRIVFFNDVTKKALVRYFDTYSKNFSLTCLFPERECQRMFKNSSLLVKDLRKYFSQEWDRRGGPTSIKKILMGHSLKGDVDLMHYNAQSPEDLKRIYDKVMEKMSITID